MWQRITPFLPTAGKVAFVGLCWIPTFGPGANSWQDRLICLLLVLPLMTALVYFSLLNIGKDRIALQGRAKKRLDESHDALKTGFLKLFRIKESSWNEVFLPKLKKFWQLAVIGATLLFTMAITLPFEWAGLKALKVGNAASISGTVEKNDLTIWFLAESISLGDPENQKDFYYFLGSKHLKVGNRYSLLTLAGYPIILQQTEIPQGPETFRRADSAP